MRTDNGERPGFRGNLSRAALGAVRRNTVLPVYFAIDISCSVDLDVLRQIGLQIASLITALASYTRISSNIYAEIIEFDGRPRVLMPLTTVRTIEYFPELSRGYDTGYDALFFFLRNEISQDIQMITRNGRSIGQPLVVVATDGRFEKNWQEEFFRLTEYDPEQAQGFEWRPAVLPMALAGGDIVNIKKLCAPAALCYPHLVQDNVANSEILISVVEHLLERVLVTPAPVIDVNDFL